jgi:hypothetical protein
MRQLPLAFVIRSTFVVYIAVDGRSFHRPYAEAHLIVPDQPSSDKGIGARKNS